MGVNSLSSVLSPLVFSSFGFGLLVFDPFGILYTVDFPTVGFPTGRFYYSGFSDGRFFRCRFSPMSVFSSVGLSDKNFGVADMSQNQPIN